MIYFSLKSNSSHKEFYLYVRSIEGLRIVSDKLEIVLKQRHNSDYIYNEVITNIDKENAISDVEIGLIRFDDWFANKDKQGLKQKYFTSTIYKENQKLKKPLV